MTNEIRKKDARNKIMLGGLIVKAGRRDKDASFILGVLINASKTPINSNEYINLKKLGAASLLTK